MLTARQNVRFSCGFRYSFRDAGAPLIERRRLRDLLYMEPTNAKLAFPALAVRHRFPKAGLYERTDEFRTGFGYPFIGVTRYVFIDHAAPLFGVEFARWQERAAVDTSVMLAVDELCHQISVVTDDNR